LVASEIAVALEKFGKVDTGLISTQASRRQPAFVCA
jgi:hypothetical protein